MHRYAEEMGAAVTAADGLGWGDCQWSVESSEGTNHQMMRVWVELEW